MHALISPAGHLFSVSPTTTQKRKKKKKKNYRNFRILSTSPGAFLHVRAYLPTQMRVEKRREPRIVDVPFAPPKRASIKASGCCFGTLTGRQLPSQLVLQPCFRVCDRQQLILPPPPSPRRLYASAHHRRHWTSWSICV